MKSLRNFFTGSGSNVDPEKVENYFGHGTQNHNEHIFSLPGKYYCPMKCEGDKTYDQPGNCPVCNMNLVAAKNPDKHQEHDNQSHCC